MNKHKVYIINKSHHDYTPALKYGELVYLSEGIIPPYDVSNMARMFQPIIDESGEHDYILQTSLTTMNMVASAMFAHKHGRLNLLLFKSGGYKERKIVL